LIRAAQAQQCGAGEQRCTGPETASREKASTYDDFVNSLPSPLTNANPATAPAGATDEPLQHAWYRALLTRDARFDGRLYVGVTSTGIYCRPVCRVRAPRQENCRFYASAALAESEGFRPCLRCRPELAPGLAMIDTPQALAQRAALLLQRAVADGRQLALTELASKLGVTDRHLRRVFLAAHGVTPLAWLTTQRLLLAKQLLTDTALPVTEVALASGYASLRRFQAAFAEHYRLTPGALRRGARDQDHTITNSTSNATSGSNAASAGLHSDAVAKTGGAGARSRQKRVAEKADVQASAVDPALSTLREQLRASALTLRLSYRPPYDTAGLLAFFQRRAVPGLEVVHRPADAAIASACLRRSLAVMNQGQQLAGWVELVWDEGRNDVVVALAPSLAPALGSVRLALRQALDLDADPSAVVDVLASVPGDHHPGVRVPGAFGAAGGFEAAVRVVLGQQISVAAARTITSRLVLALGEQVETPWAEVNHLFPTAAAIAQASPDQIGQLGIVRQRVRALQALAKAVCDGLPLDASADIPATLDALRALPGIGEWSAQLIALRALAWPDAFAASDLGVLMALEGPGGARDAAAAQQRSLAWRPWRAYALMKLWHQLETPAN
jgi:AraC family transcriptional regulator of adaptative response / DNA-3-methyladenine glycosylase II